MKMACHNGVDYGLVHIAGNWKIVGWVVGGGSYESDKMEVVRLHASCLKI